MPYGMEDVRGYAVKLINGCKINICTKGQPAGVDPQSHLHNEQCPDSHIYLQPTNSGIATGAQHPF